MGQTQDKNLSGTIRVAVMWRVDPANPSAPTSYDARLRPVIDALAAQGVQAAPLLYLEEETERVRAELLGCNGVLVWINPIANGRDRSQVDPLLRDLSAAGVFVSAHPDVIAKMGAKGVLFQTRALGWGSDVDLYQTPEELARRLPENLSRGGARVLKPVRGNDGQGVLKIERCGLEGNRVRVQAASDDQVRACPIDDLMSELQAVLANCGAVIDQEFNDNASAGMVRCYMSLNRVVGFAEQRPRIEGAISDTPAFAMASAKRMHGADAAEFQDLRQVMEEDWTPGLQGLLAIETAQLPVLWDADFLFRSSPRRGRAGRFALCEINASCVSPFPEAAAAAVAAAVASRLKN